MRKLLITSVLVFSLILLPNLTHAQTIKDRVLGLFRYFQGNGLAAVKKAPTNTTQGSLAPLAGDGIVYSSDALYTWSGTSPETLTITQGTVTFTTYTFSFHPNLIVSVSGGTALFQVSNNLTGLTLNGGSATLATGTNNVLTTKSLSITGSSYLDITNGGVIVDYSGTSPLTTIKGYLLSGRPTSGIGNATWTGLGIRSSSAASAQDHDAFTVGYAENKDMPLGSYTTFMNQPVDLSSILIRFTQSTDADLDGKTGDNDVTLVGVYYDQDRTQKSFSQGDFDFNGAVGDNDVTLLGVYYNEFLQVNELVATPSSSSVTLNWNKLYTGSTVIMKQIGAGAQFQLTSTANSSLTDTAVTPGTIYTYQVKGTNGQPSNLVQVKVPAVSQVPAAPSNLVATAISSTQINLTWSDNSTNETGFILEKKTGTGSYSTVASPFQNATTYPNTNLTAATTYTYRIKATNASGDSTYSNEATATTQASACTGATQPLSCVPALSSKPGAPYTVYLDFDGAGTTSLTSYTNIPPSPAYETCTYNGSSTACYDLTTFSTAELSNINEIFSRIAEKYIPFNINVTTIDPGAPYLDKVALHVIIGGKGSWILGTNGGGASTVGSFYDTRYENNAYEFSELYPAVKAVSELAANHIGQSFGLNPQHFPGGATYNGSPDFKRAPILGDSSSSIRGMWWEAQDPNRIRIQNDMTDITIGIPDRITGDRITGIVPYGWTGTGYRPDDYGNTLQTATPLTVSGTTRTKSGIIEQAIVPDTDYFSFTTAGGSITIAITGSSAIQGNGQMLDPKFILYNSSGTQIALSDSANLNESLTTSLAAGTYYVAVSGHGMIPTYSIDYTNSPIFVGNAADVGQYTVTVTGP
jgi:hypothetical protein